MANLQLHEMLIFLETFKKLFLRAYNLRIFFIILKIGLEKFQILEKNPCDLIAAFKCRGSTMVQNVIFDILAAKCFRGGGGEVFIATFFSQKLKPIHNRCYIKYNLFIKF